MKEIPKPSESERGAFLEYAEKLMVRSSEGEILFSPVDVPLLLDELDITNTLRNQIHSLYTDWQPTFLIAYTDKPPDLPDYIVSIVDDLFPEESQDKQNRDNKLEQPDIWCTLDKITLLYTTAKTEEKVKTMIRGRYSKSESDEYIEEFDRVKTKLGNLIRSLYEDRNVVDIRGYFFWDDFMNSSESVPAL